MGFEITGFDPAYEGTNKDIIKEYFTPAAQVHRDGIILRHVLEHVQDPVAFLVNIRDSNNGNGKIYIEVPCFDWICRHRAWFDIFYEHVNYFRMDDFRRMFGKYMKAVIFWRPISLCGCRSGELAQTRLRQGAGIGLSA